MGIGWMWHFTRSAESDTLRVANEARAASAYARWRAFHERLDALFRRARDVRRERAASGELDTLPNALLRDVGLWRDGDGTIVPERRPRPQRPIAEVLVLEGSDRRRVSDTSVRRGHDREETRRCA